MFYNTLKFLALIIQPKPVRKPQLLVLNGSNVYLNYRRLKYLALFQNHVITTTPRVGRLSYHPITLSHRNRSC